MRKLLLMRGAPGSGKSTWIKEHNLEEYTLSPDTLRTMCSSLKRDSYGNFSISQDVDTSVWKILFQLLEIRMSRGEFIVVDATCSKTKDITKYKELADSYRYRIYIVDFTDVPLETCLAQNKLRPQYKWVPENAIRNIYARFATQQIPSGVKLIKRDEFKTIVEETPLDLSSYSKIVFIGDIHGCYDTLMQYPDFKNGLKDDVEYIFLGDLTDRGNQNVEVINFIYSIKDKPNVCLIEGNHESYIYNYGNDVPPKGKSVTKTFKELENSNFDKKIARNYYRKFRQLSYIYYNGIEILATHGGLPNLKQNLLYVPTIDFIRGVGSYEDYLQIAKSWLEQTNEKQYQVFGHRNTELSPTKINERVFVLEGSVERNGELRIVEVDKNLNWKTISIPTQPSNAYVEEVVEQITSTNDKSLLEILRSDKYISEKDLGNGISSFNFTRDAFYERNWNTQTILARGLFLDNQSGDVVARSYEKFFKVNEIGKTSLSSLKQFMEFPAYAYVKENGFLGIVSLHNDELFIASKSTDKGDYVTYFKTLLQPYADNIKEYLRKNPKLSLVFEVIDKDNDPHIIEYNESHIVLLDVIVNEIKFKKLPYSALQEIGKKIGCEIKHIYKKIVDWNDFLDVVNDNNYMYNENIIEGLVVEDKNGFMVKMKSIYYDQWKKLRGVADSVLKHGYITKTGMLNNPLENYFYGFLRDLYKNYYNKETKKYPFPTDIISLRKKYLEVHHE